MKFKKFFLLITMLIGSVYHHGMARPQVQDRVNGLQVWRVAANVMNKRLQTADGLGFGRG